MKNKFQRFLILFFLSFTFLLSNNPIFYTNDNNFFFDSYLTDNLPGSYFPNFFLENYAPDITLLVEENNHMGANEELERELKQLNQDLEKHSGATEKLRKLGQLKGKISNKVSTITKEHKFFIENII